MRSHVYCDFSGSAQHRRVIPSFPSTCPRWVLPESPRLRADASVPNRRAPSAFKSAAIPGCGGVGYGARHRPTTSGHPPESTAGIHPERLSGYGPAWCQTAAASGVGHSPTQDHVIHQERMHEQRHDRVHLPPPALLAQPFQATLAQDLLQDGATGGRELTSSRGR